jgi:hypothetical protein
MENLHSTVATLKGTLLKTESELEMSKLVGLRANEAIEVLRREKLELDEQVQALKQELSRTAQEVTGIKQNHSTKWTGMKLAIEAKYESLSKQHGEQCEAVR